jgi:hypothetical protein
MRRHAFPFGVLFLALLAPAAAAQEGSKVAFEEHVKPLLRKHCGACHNEERRRGGLDITTLDAVLRGGDSGKVVQAGKPGASLLYLLTTQVEAPHMPPNGRKLSPSDLGLIRGWIEGGLLASGESVVKAPGGARPQPPAGTGQQTPQQQTSAVAPAPKQAPMPVGLPIGPVQRAARPPAVTALALSPNAPLAAVLGDRQVLLYHTETRQLLGLLSFPEGDVSVLRFSRDGRHLLAGGGQGGQSGRVVVWDVTTGKRAFAVGDEGDSVLAADLSPDAQLVALGGPGRVVKIYSAAGKLVHALKKHADWMTCLEFSRDGLLLASGDRNGGLFVWEVKGGKEFLNLRGHTGPVHALRWRADADVLASAGQDGSVRLWDMHQERQVQSWTAHAEGTLGLDFARDGRLVTGGRDRLVRTWGGDGKPLLTFEPFGDQVLRVGFSHDGSRVIAGDWAGEARVCQAADGNVLGTLRAAADTVASAPVKPTPRAANPPPALARLRAKYDQAQGEAAQAQARAREAAAEAAAFQKLLTEASAGVTAAETALGKARETAAQIAKLASARATEAQAAEGRARQAQAAADRLKGDLAVAKSALAENPAALKAKADQTRALLEAARAQAEEKQTLLKTARDTATKLRASAGKSPDRPALAQAVNHAEDLVRLLDAELKAAEQVVAQRTQEFRQAAQALEAARKLLGAEGEE